MDKVTHTPTAEGKRRNFFAKATGKLVNKCKKAMVAITTMYVMGMATAISAFAAPVTSGTTSGADQGEAMFNNLIGFFATWIGRIGLVVGFIGAIMFGLAIKNEDADAKTRGLMTMASGFVVFAVTLSLDLFGITT